MNSTKFEEFKKIVLAHLESTNFSTGVNSEYFTSSFITDAESTEKFSELSKLFMENDVMDDLEECLEDYFSN